MTNNANRLEEQFQQLIRQKITLKGDQIKATNCHLQNVLIHKMRDEMKKDETFNRLYKQPHYVGSFYENLRVGAPTEFDLNLELELPIPGSEIQIETRNATPGFARIKVGTTFSANTTEAVKRKIERWLDDGYLNKDKVFQWLQGVVDRALRNIQWDPDMRVERSTSGPAVTLNIWKGKKRFDVDLVPVFVFGEDRWPSAPLRQLKDLPRPSSAARKWCVVPKAPRGKKISVEWRMSFYMHEKDVMNGQNNMKPVIKLFKLLRDNQNWSGLSSYYIKTLFMWEMNVQHFWRNGLGYLFMHMLGRLQNYLEKREIPFFWDQRCNLIDHLNNSEISNMCGRVTRLKKKLENALESPNNDLKSVINDLFTPKSRCEVEEQVQQQLSWLNFGEMPRGRTAAGEQQQQPEQQNSWWNVAAMAGGLVVALGALAAGNHRNNNG